MAIYTIPKYKFSELEKQIEKIRRKGANVVFNIVNDNALYPYRDQGSFTDFNIACYEVEISGQYIINGWTFVATIEHSTPENIIRLADQRFSGRIPEKYRTAPKDCEHCHIRRDRTDTYLIYNEGEDDWKQVGRTCLKNYTQGLDVEVCASMVDIFAEIAKISNDAQSGSFDIDLNNAMQRDNFVLNSAIVRAQILKYIKDNGYLPVRTMNDFKEKLFKGEHLLKAMPEDIEKISDAANKLTPSDWSRNAIAAWNKEHIEVRDFALIASLCKVCLENITKEIARRNIQQLPSNSYAGEIGDIVDFVITSVMVSHYRTPNVYRASSYPVYRMTDEEGKVYMWGCTNPEIELEPGKHVKGKIKTTFERRNGEKVTELTRCKVY